MTAAEYFGGKKYIDRTYPACHPMRELLVESNPTTTTVSAFDLVYAVGDRHWLEGAKRDVDAIPNPGSPRMDDVAAFNSVLGELRAYADLLRIPGYVVSSSGRGKEGPDFTLTNKNDGHIVRVEVFSYPPRPDYVIEIGSPTKQCFTDPKLGSCSITTQIAVQDPFGFPDENKPGDSTTANMISKICARKGSESQLASNEDSLLFVDLQTVPISTVMIEHVTPILYGNSGEVTSGAIWYAFYGKKGYPIFESANPYWWKRVNCVRMQHNGHLCNDKPSKANAVLVSVGPKDSDPDFKRLVCLENPRKRLPPLMQNAIEESGLIDPLNSRMGVSLVADLAKDRQDISAELDRFRSWHPDHAAGLKVCE